MTITRTLWLFLMRDGGRWEARALSEQLGIDGERAFPALRQMYDRGMVKRHVPQDYGSKRMTYEVDEDCRIPDNLTLREVRS